MSQTVEFQAQFFLISILFGAAIVILYDVLRILRRIKKHSNFFIALEDVLFWIFSGFMIFIMLYKENNGIIRGFAILGMFIGMVIYNVTISRFFVKYISMFINKIIHLIFKIIGFILKPFIFIMGKIKGLLKFCFKKIKRFLKNLLKRLKKFIKKIKITISNS